MQILKFNNIFILILVFLFNFNIFSVETLEQKIEVDDHLYIVSSIQKYNWGYKVGLYENETSACSLECSRTNMSIKCNLIKIGIILSVDYKLYDTVENMYKKTGNFNKNSFSSNTDWRCY